MAACGGDPGESPEESPDAGLGLETEPAGEIEGKLLGAGDLPPGWEELDAAGSDDVSDQESGFCNEPIPDEENATGSASTQFFKGEETTRLVETVVTYENPEDATAAFNKVRDVTGTCKTWDLEEEGTVSRFELTTSEFPNVADETIAVRITSDFSVNAGSGAKPAPTEGFVTGDTVIARHDSTIVVVRHFSIGLGSQPSFAAADTEPAVRAAVQKVMQ